jgi:hypothetical protein
LELILYGKTIVDIISSLFYYGHIFPLSESLLSTHDLKYGAGGKSTHQPLYKSIHQSYVFILHCIGLNTKED